MMTTSEDVNLDELVQEVIREFPPREPGIRDGWVKKIGIGRREIVGKQIIDEENTAIHSNDDMPSTVHPNDDIPSTVHPNDDIPSTVDSNDDIPFTVPEYFSSQYVWSDFDESEAHIAARTSPTKFDHDLVETMSDLISSPFHKFFSFSPFHNEFSPCMLRRRDFFYF